MKDGKIDRPPVGKDRKLLRDAIARAAAIGIAAQSVVAEAHEAPRSVASAEPSIRQSVREDRARILRDTDLRDRGMPLGTRRIIAEERAARRTEQAEISESKAQNIVQAYARYKSDNEKRFNEALSRLAKDSRRPDRFEDPDVSDTETTTARVQAHAGRQLLLKITKLIKNIGPLFNIAESAGYSKLYSEETLADMQKANELFAELAEYHAKAPKVFKYLYEHRLMKDVIQKIKDRKTLEEIERSEEPKATPPRQNSDKG